MPDTQTIPPFSCSFSAGVPELLWRLRVSLVITTYQAGKIIFISPNENGKITQLPRSFPRPMGLSVDGDKLAVATKDSVILFHNHPGLANGYPTRPSYYDALFIPRAIFNSGPLDLHDLHFENNEITAVNTAFSCVCKLSNINSFETIWKPEFISALEPEDRCHLNGLAMNGNQKMVTAFGTTDTPRGWKENLMSSGILMDMDNNQIVLNGLAMPHSPRWFNHELYLLLSGTGQLIKVNIEKRTYEEILSLNRFVRGLAFHGEYVFVGFSCLRKQSSSFGKIVTEKFQDEAGVSVFHLPTRKLAGEIIYQSSVEEIYDVQILPGFLRPNILSMEKEGTNLAISAGEKSWWVKTKNDNAE